MLLHLYTGRKYNKSAYGGLNSKTMATLLLVIIYAAFIGLGLPDSLLGTAWPVAHTDLGVPLGVAGFVSIVSTLGTVISSLVSERMIKKYGTGVVAAVSVLMTSMALLGMSFVGHFWVVLALAIPLGMGAGTIDTALNNYVALNYRAHHMNWLHSFWGIGATCGPLIMSVFLVSRNWHGAYRTISFTLLGIAAVLFASLPLWKKLNGTPAAEERKAPVPKRELIRRPGAVFACLAFFTYCAAEYTAGLWASSYFVKVKGIAPDIAASWASMYYLGITAGRVLSGFAALKLSSRALVRIGQCAILAGIAILIPFGGTAQIIGLLLIGVGCAPIFPSLLDETPRLFGADYSQGMMGLQFAGAYLGGTIMPPLFGWISPIIGLDIWPVYLLLLFGALIFSTECTQRAVYISKLKETERVNA
jgi:fucose permease